jgi:hypothetical protein
MVDPSPGELAAGEPVPGAVTNARTVRFDGGSTGAGGLSWGQRELWLVIEEKHNWLPIGTVLPLPAGTTVEKAAGDLEFTMSSYPTMRTRLRLDPDGPTQVVHASGELRMEIVDIPDDADPAEAAKLVLKRYKETDYDFVSDWPVRVAVIRHRGVLTHRAWVMCHLVTDGSGSRVVLEERACRDRSGSATAWSALEQARWQGSPAGLRQSGTALRYWERVLREVPARRFPPRTERPYPRYWQAKSGSPATDLAIRALSARTGVEGRSVLLAVFAVALARVIGADPVVLKLVVGNRFRPKLGRSVSPIIQSGLFVLDPGGTVEEVIARTRRQAMTAYKHAYYDPYRRQELIARMSAERGEELDLDCSFNDRRLKPRDESGPAPSPEQIRAALPESYFEWRYKQDRVEFNRLFVSIDDEPDTMATTVTADIHHIAPEAVEACVRQMEEVAVAAALDPAARTGVVAHSGAGP